MPFSGKCTYILLDLSVPAFMAQTLDRAGTPRYIRFV